MLLQALAFLFFTAALFAAFATIALMLRDDWDAVTTALGLTRVGQDSAPLPPRYRVRQSRSASVVRFEAPTPRQQRAAA